jgi:histone deacetylase 8
MSRTLPLDTEIPDHFAFPAYGPSFTLDIPAGNMRDLNGEEYLTEIEHCFGRVVKLIRERLSDAGLDMT